jgi:hypothetical protein
VSQFRKLPIIIDAMQYDPFNQRPVCVWLDEHGWEWSATYGFRIRTLESGTGWHVVTPGDWIIKGVQGEFYPCKPDIFAATYEALAP